MKALIYHEVVLVIFYSQSFVPITSLNTLIWQSANFALQNNSLNHMFYRREVELLGRSLGRVDEGEGKKVLGRQCEVDDTILLVRAESRGRVRCHGHEIIRLASCVEHAWTCKRDRVFGCELEQCQACRILIHGRLHQEPFPAFVAPLQIPLGVGIHDDDVGVGHCDVWTDFPCGVCEHVIGSCGRILHEADIVGGVCGIPLGGQEIAIAIPASLRLELVNTSGVTILCGIRAQRPVREHGFLCRGANVFVGREPEFGRMTARQTNGNKREEQHIPHPAESKCDLPLELLYETAEKT